MTCFGVANIASKIFYDSDILHGMTFICSEDLLNTRQLRSVNRVRQRHLKLEVVILRLSYQNIVSTNKWEPLLYT